MQVQDKHHGKDQGMTRVKVITEKHNQEGEAINGEVGEALSSNNDEKEEALKGRFKVGMWQGHRYHEGLKVTTEKDVGEEVNVHKN
jgi:hypothetical protein